MEEIDEMYDSMVENDTDIDDDDGDVAIMGRDNRLCHGMVCYAMVTNVSANWNSPSANTVQRVSVSRSVQLRSRFSPRFFRHVFPLPRSFPDILQLLSLF